MCRPGGALAGVVVRLGGTVRLHHGHLVDLLADLAGGGGDR
jgi:hypothetical protein